jgi:hypothetical protein
MMFPHNRYGSGMAQHESIARIEALCWRMGRKVPTR